MNLQSGLVLFVGMVRRGEFETLKARGIPLGVLVDTNNKQRVGDTSGFVVAERFDFSRPLSELIEAIRTIQNKHEIACLYNVVELYVGQTAAAAEALGLSGISSASARLCLDKSLMRERFQERIGPTSCARFQQVESETDVLQFAGSYGYPVFLQPTNISASMWATRNNSEETLLRNYRMMCAEVPEHYKSLGQPSKVLTIVAAEYLDGSNASVDCLIDAQGNVSVTPPVEVLTGQDIGVDDFHHFARILPPRFDLDYQQHLEQLAVAGVRSLDMKSCAAHVEFIGRRLGEIAARPGANRARIMEMAYGIDLLYGYYQVLRGQTPQLSRNKHLAAAVVTPFARTNGTLRNIKHLERLPQLPGYLYHEVRCQIGHETGLSKQGFRAPLYIELLSPDPAVVRGSVDEIASWSDLYAME